MIAILPIHKSGTCFPSEPHMIPVDPVKKRFGKFPGLINITGISDFLSNFLSNDVKKSEIIFSHEIVPKKNTHLMQGPTLTAANVSRLRPVLVYLTDSFFGVFSRPVLACDKR